MLASNPSRNSQPELIKTMGMAQSSRCAVEFGWELLAGGGAPIQTRGTDPSSDERFRNASENAR